MKKALKNAILLIASAQRHSDEGKAYNYGQNTLVFKNTSHGYGYDGKDKCILSAIKLIDSQPYMGVNYYVTVDNKYDSYLVYFNVKLDGKRYQVSFHSFSKGLKKYLGKGSPCRWEKKIDSRETCLILLKLCGEEGKII